MRQFGLNPPEFSGNDISWMKTKNNNGLTTDLSGKVNVERLVESLNSFIYLRELRSKPTLHSDVSAWVEQLDATTLDGLNDKDLMILGKTLLRFDIKLHEKLHAHAVAREDRFRQIANGARKATAPGQATEKLALIKLLWAEELTTSPFGFLQAVDVPKSTIQHPKLPERYAE